MATIEKRPTKDGKVIRWRVKWRTGGRRDGDWDGRTLDSNTDARRLKALVEANGEHMPSVDQLLQHGLKYLVPAGLMAAPATTMPEPQSAPAVSFREYALEWLEQLVKPHPETKRKYRERLEKHVFPLLGDRPIDEITRREMRKWQQSLQAAGLSPKTIANVRGESVVPIFRAACLPGEDEEPAVRTYNPMIGLPLPEAVRPERDILETPEQAVIFLETAYEVDPEAADLLVTKLAGALRWGEVSALPPRAVRVPRGTIEIMQVLRKVNRRWVVEPKPKTKAGYRQVPLPEQVMRMAVIAPGLLSEGDPDLVGVLAGGDPSDAAEAKQDRLIRLLVARWIATEEDNVDRLGRKGIGTWRTDEARGVAWLDRLTSAGYELSDAETSLRGDLIAAVAKAEAARQANIAAQRAREEAARLAVDEDGEDEPVPAQFVLYHLTHDDVWVLSDDDSGQPVGELPADADAVEQAKMWAAEAIAGYGYTVAGWRTEHDSAAAAADYYVAEPATAEPEGGGAGEGRNEDPDAGQTEQPAGDAESATDDGGDIQATPND